MMESGLSQALDVELDSKRNTQPDCLQTENIHIISPMVAAPFHLPVRQLQDQS